MSPMPRATSMRARDFAQLAQADVIKLELPERLEMAYSSRYWGPQKLRPFTFLSHVQPSEWGDEFKPPPIVDKAPDAPVLVITSYIGRPRVSMDLCCDIYRASMRDGDRQLSGLVLKIVDLNYLPPESGSSEQPSQLRGWSEFRDETAAFDLGARVQGGALPRFCGMFGRGTLLCLVFEDAGTRIPWSERETLKLQAEVIAAVKAIQKADIAPIIDQWRWIRRGRDGRIKIATLFEAYTKDNVQREKLEVTPEEAMEAFKQFGLERVAQEFPDPWKPGDIRWHETAPSDCASIHILSDGDDDDEE